MKKRCILLDLDGTITDSSLGITKSAAYALDKFDIKIENLKELNKFIGPPLRESFKKFYGMNDEEAERAVTYYREYYGKKGIIENEVYQGIPELIKSLENRGIRLAIATAKAEVYAKEILEYFSIESYFENVVGSELDGSRGKKCEIIDCVLQNMNINDYREVVMIGDRKHDINGAIKNGIDCIGVLYGYGSEEELADAGANYIVNSVDDLEKLLYSIT